MISFIIPFRSEEPERIRAFQYVHTHLQFDWPDAEIIVADWPLEDESWERSKSRNRGAAYACGDVLVFHDADSWVPHKQLRASIAAVETSSWSHPFDCYFTLSQEGTEGYFADPEYDVVVGDCEYLYGMLPEVGYDGSISNIKSPGNMRVHKDGTVDIDRAGMPDMLMPDGGVVVITREAFSRVRGWDERFIGWGEEDRAFALSLRTLVGPSARIPGPLYHFFHQTAVWGQFEQPHFQENRALCDRYRAASGNPSAMSALVAEH